MIKDKIKILKKQVVKVINKMMIYLAKTLREEKKDLNKKIPKLQKI